MNKITVSGYHWELARHTAEKTGNFFLFQEPREAIKITGEIGSFVDSYGDANYFLLEEIPASEFTSVPVTNTSERGQSLLAYALLLSLVGLFVYAGLGLLGVVPNIIPSLYNALVALFA